MESSTRKMQKQVKYRCKFAEKCVTTDWFGQFLIFDDRQFERAFHLRKVMVEEMIWKLIQHDRLWAHTCNCFGELDISP